MASGLKPGSAKQPPGLMAPRTMTLARSRLEQLGLLVGAMNLIVIPFWGLSHSIFQNPVMVALMVMHLGAALSLDATIVIAARDKHLGDETVIRMGFAYHVLRSATLATFPVVFEGMLGYDPPTVTFACALVAGFPLMVPTPLRTTTVVSCLAAATQPLAVILFAVGPISLALVGASALYAGIAAVAAILCGRVSYGLSITARSTRELGTYQLVKRIGVGGAGEVWRAKHRHLARPTAIKMARLEGQSMRGKRSATRRFEKEAQVTARLKSPHTVTLYDYGVSDDGTYFVAMEYLRGCDLQRYVDQRGPCSPQEAVQIALQICDSLGEAHELGLVHRDLKPANLFRARVGLRSDFIKVLDFGWAEFERRLDVRVSGLSSSSKRLAGTPAYVSPETLLEKPVDGRSDIYQLGCVLYFLLTGKEAFKRRTVQLTAMAHLVDRIQGADAASPWSVPPELDAIIARCLEKEPRDRFASADELESALLSIPEEVLELREHEDSATWVPGRISEPEPEEDDERASTPIPGFQAVPAKRRERAGGRTGLSAELTSLARARLAKLGYLVCGLSVITFPLWLLLNPAVAMSPAAGPEELLLFLLGISLDLALVFTANDESIEDDDAMRIALGYLVLRCAVISVALVRAHALLGLDPPTRGLSILMILVFPLFVPIEPRRLVLPSALAAAAQPLTLAFLSFRSADHELVLDASVRGLVVMVGSLFLAHAVTSLRQASLNDGAIGSYRLLEEVGHGSMGKVWRAQHLLLARPAAIKTIGVDAASPGADQRAVLRRFQREAQVTATLTSPHTVTLYDYGVTADDTCYYVMELLQGTDLQRLVENEGAQTSARVIDIALQVCDSLAEAHAYGLVHRDLKPANLFQAHIGRRTDYIKVLDFGLAELVRRLRVGKDVSVQATARVAGTPAYMPPETLMEQNVDGRADLYQLGCVMYFLLTGHPVFERTSATALALAHASDPPPRPSEDAPFPVPEALDGIILRCLEKSPANRFSSAIELDAALRTVQRAEAEHARREGYVEGPAALH